MSDIITNAVEEVGGNDIEMNINPNPNTVTDGVEMEAPPPPPPPQADGAKSPFPPPVSVVRKLGIVICSIVLVPVAALFAMVYGVCGGDIIGGDETAEIKEQRYAGSLYEKVQLHIQPREMMRARSWVMTSRLGCVILVWLLLSTLALRGSTLKTATLLGVIHWKWSLLAAFLFLSYPFIGFTLHTHGKVYFRYLEDRRSQLHYYSYYFWDGLFDSLVSLLHVASVFLLWMLYFHAHEGLNAGFDKYATRTLVVVLVAALLWLLKTALLLRWQQKSVYEKFRPRILMSGFRLNILLSFFDGWARMALLPSRFHGYGSNIVDLDYRESSYFSKKKAIEYIVSSAYVSLVDLRLAADRLGVLTKIGGPRSTEDDLQLSAVLDAYQKKIDTTFSDNPNEVTTEMIMKDHLKESEYTLLEDVVRVEYPTKCLNQVSFDKWVVDAHKSCLSVAYTLADAFAMVSALDTILTSCLVMAVIVVWLLVTELASTTVLVVIASPFLALSFVFGDVCKNFFQGFIFAFVSHPFDIGDRCIINGDEVEVKRISIMTTTCLKIGTNEKVIYSNSSLAPNFIINLGDKLDPNDAIELTLHSSTKMNDILDMKKHIESFIDSDEQRVSFEKEHKVVMKEINNGFKIVVSFQHTTDGKDVGFSQFLEKKKEQRSTLLFEIKEFMENLGVEVAAS